MSYTVATPGGKSRPATVSAASALLFVCAAVEVVSLVLTVMRIAPTLKVLNDEFATTPGADAFRTYITIVAVAGAVVAGLFAIGAIVLAVLLRKGKNPARIVTWVLGGIGVLCYACGIGGTALSSSLNGVNGSSSNPDAEAIQKRLMEIVPSWQNVLGTVTSVVLLLVLLVVIILLALPASNEFFRKEAEVWVPPTWPGDGAAAYPPPLPPTAPPPGQFGPPSGPPSAP